MTLKNVLKALFPDWIYGASSVVLIVAISWSIRLARADYDAAQSDLPSVARACELAPGSATYWLRYSAVRQVDQPDDPSVDAAVAHALQLNPRYTEAWMERALRDEIHGRTRETERDYLNAARVDHMYKPAWALANFYIRQDNLEEFWRYARKCLEVVEPRRLEPVSYNPTPVFDLAWHVSQDPAEIRRKLIPPRHFILVDYLEYLRLHNQLEPGADVAMDLAASGDRDDNFVLLNFCQQLIDQQLIRMSRGGRAVDLWNAMAARGALHSEHLDAERGASLTNADLKRPFERAGFDWQMPQAEGVLQDHFANQGEVRFVFSGDQPEGVLVLYQNVPVVEGGRYRLSFRYRTPDLDHIEGLAWTVWDHAGQREIQTDCQLATQPDWKRGEARFTVPKGVTMVRLGLVYRRASGSTRIRGTTAFAGFALACEEAAKS
jgi:hypothetical protein